MTRADKIAMGVLYVAALTFMTMGLIDILKHMASHGGF
jgi:hypothetical protein